MPADPHQWQTNDFVSATLLDGDFYLSQGQAFAPNGIRFHAYRPLYKAYNANSGNTLAVNGWGKAFGNSSDVGGSNVIVDTPGLIGAWFDPGQSGSVNLNDLTGGGGSMGGGGLSPTNGGIMLGIGYTLWPQTSNTSNLIAGIGNGTTSSSAPASYGTFQATNSAHQVCCFTVDLMDSNPGFRWCAVAQNGSSASLAPASTANADGSGWASRMIAFWASVYSNMANATGSLPAPLTSWTGQTITASLLNGSTGLRPMLRFLNAPPMLRAQATATQSLTSGTATTATNLAATSGYNTWSAFSSNTFTAPVTGLYLFHGYANIGNISAPFRVGVQVNGGTTLWGPWTAAPSSGSLSGTKTHILSLNANDTVVMRLQANANATTNNSFAPARMIMLYLGGLGFPSITVTPPDTTYRWAAGTQGPLDPIFNAHVANDLTFLNQRPYFQGYQTVAQSISMNSATVVTMDTVSGLVHGDAGDPWSGWNSSTHLYTAPVSGWYLVCHENFLVQATLTSTPIATAGFKLNPAGTDSNDRYQQQNLPNTTGGGGATALSIYYLRAGDTIGPVIETWDSSATTLNTSTAASNQSHFELVWLGEG